MPSDDEQRFRDRAEAGRILARELGEYRGRPGVIVLALPRGGVPVGYEVAAALGAPLDVFVVRKLGVPGHEELAMGAIASGGVRVINPAVVEPLGIPPAVIDRVARIEGAELRRREQAYRGGDRPPVDVRGRTVILVDDGLATGSTMRAAAAALRRQQPAELVVAVPVAADPTCDEFRGEVDRIVCARTPEPFHAVGLWYEDFSQTTDAEVRELLARARQAAVPPGAGTTSQSLGAK
jgi:predicted phosphoribosyltransferase